MWRAVGSVPSWRCPCRLSRAGRHLAQRDMAQGQRRVGRAQSARVYCVVNPASRSWSSLPEHELFLPGRLPPRRIDEQQNAVVVPPEQFCAHLSVRPFGVAFSSMTRPPTVSRAPVCLSGAFTKCVTTSSSPASRPASWSGNGAAARAWLRAAPCHAASRARTVAPVAGSACRLGGRDVADELGAVLVLVVSVSALLPGRWKDSPGMHEPGPLPPVQCQLVCTRATVRRAPAGRASEQSTQRWCNRCLSPAVTRPDRSDCFSGAAPTTADVRCVLCAAPDCPPSSVPLLLSYSSRQFPRG